MNENEYRVCAKILEAIFRRPISRFFWDHPADVTNPGIVHPFSLSWVCARLSDGKYATPSDVMRDVRTCLQNGKNSSPPGSVRASAAHHLLLELEALITSLRPTSFPVILPISFAVAEFNAKAAVPAHRAIKVEPLGRQPASEVFRRPADASDLSALIRDIKFLSTGFLTARLAVLVKKVQPEGVTIGDDISFNIGVMTDATRQVVRKYLDTLMFDAATGTIDPFERAFGAKLGLVRIQERGMYWGAGAGDWASQKEERIGKTRTLE
jgi:hypothetical protein